MSGGKYEAGNDGRKESRPTAEAPGGALADTLNPPQQHSLFNRDSWEGTGHLP